MFLTRTSRTVSGKVFDPVRMSKQSEPPPFSSAINMNAALTLPSIISLARFEQFVGQIS